MRHGALAIGFAALYYVTGKLGLMLNLGDLAATSVWPPTGLLLAAMLLLGCPAFPGPILGAFIGSWAVTGSPQAAAGLAVGNVAAACLSAKLLKRLEADFYSPQGLLTLSVVAVFGAILSATASLLFHPGWLLWWGANTISVIVFAPAAIYWREHPRLSWPPARLLEAAGLFTAASLFKYGVFGLRHGLPIGYVALPPLAWAAVRFGLRETATLNVLLTVLAAWGTARYTGPYPGAPHLAQAFVGVASVLSLVLAAAVWQTKDAAERLRLSEERLRLAAEAAGIGTWDWFSKEKRLISSPRSRELFGFGKDEEPDLEAFRSRVLREDLVLIDESLAGAEERGGYVEHEYRIRRPGGELRWLLTRGRLDGKTGRLNAVVIDVTERKTAGEELERRVRERTSELARANAELEAFTHSLSHDLRAGLRKVGIFAEMIQKDGGTKLGEEGRNFFERMEAAVRQMMRIMDGLLRLSTLHRAPMRLEAVDLAALARELGGELKSLYPACPVEFISPPRLEARADKALIRDVLRHLLENAWKFTCESRAARIEFGRREDGRYFVKDNGPGFEMPYSERIFGAFERLHSVEQAPGVGVGLAVVRRIIERHGGKVWAEAHVGQGATFYFTLGTA